MANSKKILKDIQKIRSQKIEALKKDIEKGTYQIRGEIIAEKAISRSIFDDVFLKNKK